MDKLINVLKDQQSLIQKGFTNFKKTPKERLIVEYIETRQDMLEKDWIKFNNTKAQLYEKFNLEDIIKQIDIESIYDQTEDIYLTYCCNMKVVLNKIRIRVDESVQPSGSSSGEVAKSTSNSLLKLPKISIPTFSGQYSEWTTFRDLFISLVHKNDSLDNVQKLHYLKGHLTGEAEQLIRHTPITDSNYNLCWSQLENRYNNKKYLSRCILQRLFSQKRMHTESSSALKDLLDTTTDCLSALRNLSIDVSTWDVIIIHIVAFKLDIETRKQWELTTGTGESNNDLPTFAQFKVFLENRFRALEFIEPKRTFHQTNHSSSSHKPRTMLATDSSSSILCEYCNEPHKLCFCKKFSKQPIEIRRDFVAKNKICFNCLGGNHMVYDCKKTSSCKVCHKRHHSLLHLNDITTNNKEHKNVDGNSNSSTTTDPIVSCLSTGNPSIPRQVLLATALIKAESRSGELQMVRALLDQGSQASFVTEATVQLLRLKKTPIKAVVSSLGADKSTVARYMVNFTIQSRVDREFNHQVNAYVLSKITSYLPERRVNASTLDWVDVHSLSLADPEFSKPNRIDILLGADTYSIIMKEGLLKSPSGNLIAQNTYFGWILSGALETVSNKRSSECIRVMHTQVNEDDILRRFWEIEEQIGINKILTPEEQRCEELYVATTKRDNEGRYVVKLPFRDDEPACQGGHSRRIAENRFKALERRLGKDRQLKDSYTEVLKEYLDLGHMREVNKNDSMKERAVYLPHHAVIRNDKSTTRVRVVFNASEKNSQGVSLNDTLMVGPTLQSDLRHTVMRWRLNEIAIVADIIKMYRQVKIADENAKYQRILWRDSPDKEITDYELMTVTFGTASAPYQAVRTLHQVAYDEGKEYEIAAERVLKCFYMDDFMSGCSTVEEGIELYKQLTELLGKGGFKLQKWNSNNQKIIDIINKIEEDNMKGQTRSKERKYYASDKDEYNENTELRTKREEKGNVCNKNDLGNKEINMKLDSTIKILGLTWRRSDDIFQYVVNLPPPTTAPVTKRSIISDIARLFDPLGWLAPSVVLAKIFIQKLWLAGVGWDEGLKAELIDEWNNYRRELSLLTKVQIPRWLGTKPGDVLELHGFCDAAKAAYSAVVYLRVTDASGFVRVALVVAKTRVAPIKQVSIPRLELCGAVLLAQLLSEAAEVLNVDSTNVRAWTDSTVVLAWLNSHPSRWKTFVANRTSTILNLFSSPHWFHVSTKENPADCASRGLLPSAFTDHELWFTGPSFLKDKVITYNRPNDLNISLEESAKVHLATVLEKTNDSIFKRFSSLTKLIRVIAYCRRLLKNNRKDTKYLQKQEIESALECCIKITQKEIFTSEYTQLKEKGYLQKKSNKLSSLCPYIDNKGLMRLRGRIENSSLEESTKHPIVLPSSCILTDLIIADAHLKTLHGGPLLMTNYIRTSYWILGARNLIKKHVRQCVICVRQRASTKTQLMGSLPPSRCTPTRPFLHTGVDYAGPINIRTTKGRGHRSYKGYLCLFVCMSTRAVHLEVVSDMTTQAFLAAFRRFVSRRGHCAKLWSDNGTTFVGASRELQQLSSIQSSVAEHLESNGTECHFIPPHSPNFGGLWEAVVKSTKFHLKRVIGDSTLTYEEMSTLLCQVEACLNSRPMSVINTEDPAEPLPLTPAHFLIGEPLVQVPDYNYETSNVNALTRWQFIQRMVQSFWKRWSQEYLATLMNRYKWSSQVPEPKIGDIVLIKEDDLPPSRWLMGRVEHKHPGNDNITRVVTIRTSSSVFKRPTSKLCILPIAVLDQ